MERELRFMIEDLERQLDEQKERNEDLEHDLKQSN